jgi:hypothetical protein
VQRWTTGRQVTEERVCKTCGTPADGSAAFCAVCDTYLGWSVNAETAGPRQPGGAPRGRAGEQGSPPPARRHRDPNAQQEEPPRQEPRPDRVVAPVASVKQAEVTLSATAPVTFEVDVKNDSTIVDSYTIHAADPPPWLTVSHGEANLLPGVLRTVTVTFAITPGVLAVAQRVTVPLSVRSGVDATRATQLSIAVTVPRSGPAATLVAQPNLIRLEDTSEGSFRLRVDNRAANFGRQYLLAGTDPEGVVRLDFVPPAVDVPPGGTAEATVRFTAPAPPPGKELSRQLILTATDPDGQVSVPVTVAQSTSPSPESMPVRIRLEPAQIALVEATAAELNVVLDNRGGHDTVKFNLSGRDPEKQVGFRFQHTRVAVLPASLGYVHLAVETTPVAKGASDTRPFTVVATADDGREIEAAGSLELASRPDAIASARISVQPEHLLTTGRKGTFAVDVDNRQGSEPLHVQLTGADEFGRARLSFRPAVLLVPPGQVARASAVIEHPRPEGGSQSTRRVQISATSAAGSISGEATFTQKADSYRRLWAVLLILLGAIVLTVGAVIWATDDPVGGIDGINDRVDQLVNDAMNDTMPAAADIVVAAVAVLLVLIGLSAALMLLGLTGAGRLVRASALFALLCGAGVLVAAPFARAVGNDTGLVFDSAVFGLVAAGAAIAFIGGVLLKR